MQQCNNLLSLSILKIITAAMFISVRLTGTGFEIEAVVDVHKITRQCFLSEKEISEIDPTFG